MIRRIQVSTEEVGERVDIFLTKKFPEYSRSQIQQGIDGKKTKVNKKIIKPSYKLKIGDKIEVDLKFLQELNTPTEPTPENIPIKILYEDKDIIAVDKAAGIVVHPAHGNTSGTLINALLYHNPKIIEAKADDSDYAATRPGIVHRLDKDTSGIIIIAKTHTVLPKLLKQWQSGQVEKYYTALVIGQIDDNGEIKTNIGRNRTERKRMAVITAGKLALTRYSKTGEYRYKNQILSLVKVRIITGRTHQIRVHMKHIGHPVIGDQTYFTKESKRISDNLGVKRQMLHASRIVLKLPTNRKKIEIISDLPKDFQSIMNKLS